MQAFSEENVTAVECIIKDDRRVTVLEIAHTMGVGLATIDGIIHEHLNMSKVCARLVPKMLTPEMKDSVQQISEKFREAFEEVKRLATEASHG